MNDKIEWVSTFKLNVSMISQITFSQAALWPQGSHIIQSAKNCIPEFKTKYWVPEGALDFAK